MVVEYSVLEGQRRDFTDKQYEVLVIGAGTSDTLAVMALAQAGKMILLLTDELLDIRVAIRGECVEK